jgi:hypothetical protein
LQGAGPDGTDGSAPVLEEEVVHKEVPRETHVEWRERSVVKAG